MKGTDAKEVSWSMAEQEEPVAALVPDALPQTETWRLREVIQYILRRHHAWLRTALDEISRLFRQANGGEDRQLSGPAALFERFRREVEDHLRKEEAVLFPLIERMERDAEAGRPPVRLPFGSLQILVACMEEDHRRADGMLRKLQQLLSPRGEGEPTLGLRESLREGLRRIAADFVPHVRLEDEVLFPRAMQLEQEENERLANAGGSPGGGQ